MSDSTKEKVIGALSATVFVFMVVVLGYSWHLVFAPETIGDPLHRKPSCEPAEPTHWVRCWSGGAVVWEELIHKAGGYRCNSQGLEVRHPTSGGLCIEEEIASEEAGVRALRSSSTSCGGR